MTTTTEPRERNLEGSALPASSIEFAERGDSLGRASIGSYLARQRELRGISLQDLCDLTRIPLRSLERLESGQFDQNPDGFARGFVRTVAHALGLDPDDTVARMLEEPSGSGEFAGPSPLAVARIAALLAIIAVLVLTIVAGRALIGIDFVGSTSTGVQRVHRVDAVRALAEASAAERHLNRAAVGATAEDPGANASGPAADATAEANREIPRNLASRPDPTLSRR